MDNQKYGNSFIYNAWDMYFMNKFNSDVIWIIKIIILNTVCEFIRFTKMWVRMYINRILKNSLKKQIIWIIIIR
jgi:hypothetical protein